MGGRLAVGWLEQIYMSIDRQVDTRYARYIYSVLEQNLTFSNIDTRITFFSCLRIKSLKAVTL